MGRLARKRVEAALRVGEISLLIWRYGSIRRQHTRGPGAALTKADRQAAICR